MTNTAQLIAHLSTHAPPARMAHPGAYAAQILAALLLYGALTQWLLLGFREDLATQLARPWFVAELTLLASVFASAVLACVLAMYPDCYQKRRLLVLPYVLAALTLCVLMVQLLLPQDARMMMPTESSHTIECALFIAAASVLPAAFIFVLLRKGATLVPLHAGALAIIVAWVIGAFTLRLAEPVDELAHLLIWHYIPTIAGALLGALLGRVAFKW